MKITCPLPCPGAGVFSEAIAACARTESAKRTAAILNTSLSTVRQWEIGEKHRATSLKLLTCWIARLKPYLKEDPLGAPSDPPEVEP